MGKFVDAQIKELQQDIKEIKKSIEHISSSVDDHMEAVKNDHNSVKITISEYNRKQEKIESKIDLFFNSITDLKDELMKMNINMIQYNASLEEHMRRTETNEQRLELMENKFIDLTIKQTKSQEEIQKFNIISATVMRVFVGIGGVFGFVWLIMQILGKMGL